MNFDFIYCAIRELKRAKFRTAAVVAGYCLTITLMIVTANLLLFSRYAENEILASTGTHFITYMPNCGDVTTLNDEELEQLAQGIIPQKCLEMCINCTGCNKKPYDILNEGFILNTNTTRLVTLELVENIKRLPTVKDASGYLLFRLRDPISSRLFTLGGFSSGSIAVKTTCCSSADLTEGKFLEPGVMGEAMLDQGFAVNMDLKPGDSISIASETVKIVGIVNTGVRPGRADVYMHFDDAEKLINRRIQNPLYQEANLILVEAMNSRVHAKAMKDVNELVQSDAIVTYGCYQPASKVLGLNERSVWAFMLIAVMGSVLFSIKTQISALIERNRQIAILKALGWKNSSVSLQIIAESTFQSIAGCALGVIVGLIILMVIPVSSILGISAEISLKLEPLLLGYILFVAVAGGIVSAVLPVLMILRQRPADILRRVW